jgi:hypothetical protein
VGVEKVSETDSQLEGAGGREGSVGGGWGTGGVVSDISQEVIVSSALGQDLFLHLPRVVYMYTNSERGVKYTCSDRGVKITQ